MSSYKIKLNPYQKKDGSYMLYLNAMNGGKRVCSVGIASDGYAPYGKGMTDGARNAVSLLLEKIDEIASIDLGGVALNFEAHGEGKGRTWLGDVFVTDKCDVSGVKVESDGAYLYRNGKLYDLSQMWIDKD